LEKEGKGERSDEPERAVAGTGVQPTGREASDKRPDLGEKNSGCYAMNWAHGFVLRLFKGDPQAS
jgi:hypothetical protein